MDFASYLGTKFDKKHLNLLKNSLPRVWHAKFGDFYEVIFRALFEGLVKINTHGRSVRYVLFYVATSKIISRYNAFLFKIGFARRWTLRQTTYTVVFMQTAIRLIISTLWYGLAANS